MKLGQGRQRACQGCREQKIRCDFGQSGDSASCSRCIRLDLECLRTVPLVRRNRNTKAALQRELESLKQQLFQGCTITSPGHDELPQAMSVGAWQPDEANTNILPTQMILHTTSNPQSTMSGTDSSDAEGTYSAAAAAAVWLEDPDTSRQLGTLPRILDGHEYDSERINDCFQLYFKLYHSQLPMLDPIPFPNDCYNQSPFLFWVIIVTGCRSYSKDPTMLESVGPQVHRMACAAMLSSSTPIQTLQALLIFCTWALPLQSLTKDVTYVACGAAIHVAMQTGLHIPGAGQDFVPISLQPTCTELTFRDRLWSLACIVCQLTSQSLGLPAAVAPDFINMDLRDDQRLSHELQFFCDLAQVQGKAMIAFMRQTAEDVTQLPGLIRSYDEKLSRLAPMIKGERRNLFLNYGRLHVNSFLFFTASDTQALDHDGLVELYGLAYKVIMGTKTTVPAKSICPDYGQRTMLLAAFIILKISRSCLADRVDFSAGEKAYFTAILMLRESSLGNDDLCARGAMVLSQLWTSKRVFRRSSDGVVDGLTLNIRSRLSMGIVFDSFWWWREEFQGKHNPYNGFFGVVPRLGSTPRLESNDPPLFQDIPDAAISSNAELNTGQQMFPIESDPFHDLTGAASFGFEMPDHLAFVV